MRPTAQSGVQALILAAGRGMRLGLADDGPKCLAGVGGRALLDRYLDAFDQWRVPTTIVVGHAADRIRSHVSARATPPTLAHNPRYREGSIVSLVVGLDALPRRGEALVLCDGDVAFDPALMQRLVHAEGSALLVDEGNRFTDEQYMAGVRAGRVAALRRGPADGFDSQGEWVGFARLTTDHVARLHTAVSARVAAGAASGGYEDELAALCVAEGDVAALSTGGLAWVEVDFPDDLARARSLFASPVS